MKTFPSGGLRPETTGNAESRGPHKNTRIIAQNPISMWLLPESADVRTFKLDCMYGHREIAEQLHTATLQAANDTDDNLL